jgi:hypothetical protein
VVCKRAAFGGGVPSTTHVLSASIDARST